MGVYTQLLVRRYLSTRIIPFIAVAAVALCVALVVIVVSVMSGFLDNLRNSGRTLMGDVVISYPVQGIPYYRDLIADIEKLPGAAAATPLVDTYGLIRMPYPDGPSKDVVTAQVWAIEPESFSRVTELDRTIWWKPAASPAEALAMGQDDPRRTMDATHYENAKALQDRATGKPGALLGMHVSVVNERQRDGSYRPRRAFWWMPNHEITVTLVPISEKGTISQSNSRVFKVVNEVMSGVFQVDKNRVFIPLKDGQELLRLDEAPLVIFNRTVFVFRGSLLGLSPEKRADRAKSTLNEMLRNDDQHTVSVKPNPAGQLIMVNDTLAFIVTQADVDPLREESLEGTAKKAATELQKVIGETKEARSFDSLLKVVITSAIATAVFATLLWMLSRLRKWISVKLVEIAARKAEALKVGDTSLLERRHVVRVLLKVLSAMRWFIVIVLTYEWLSFLLSTVPYTRPWGMKLNAYLFDVIQGIGSSILGALPGLGVAIVIFMIARFTIAFLSGVLERMS